MRYIILFLIVLFIGCSDHKSYTIKGSVPASNFNGEYVYMIPMDNYTRGRGDSALISDSCFVFKGKADSAQIYILRLQKSLSSFELQDILLVREAGEIQVKFMERSVVGGTALNDSLQKYKQRKESYDDQYFKLSNRISKADSLEKILLTSKSDSLKKESMNYHFNFAKRNSGNIVGKLVKRIMGTSFTEKQKNELGIK